MKKKRSSGASVVYNTCYGGFALSGAACQWLRDRALDVDETGWLRGGHGELTVPLPRHHALLVMCVQALGRAASGSHSSLRVKHLRGRRYRIEEYDGHESVQEPDDLDWVEVGP